MKSVPQCGSIGFSETRKATIETKRLEGTVDPTLPRFGTDFIAFTTRSIVPAQTLSDITRSCWFVTQGATAAGIAFMASSRDLR
jgi:hypothetical protein